MTPRLLNLLQFLTKCSSLLLSPYHRYLLITCLSLNILILCRRSLQSRFVFTAESSPIKNGEKKKQSPKFAPSLHHNLTGSTAILDRMSEDPLSPTAYGLVSPPPNSACGNIIFCALSETPKHLYCPEVSPLLPFVRQIQIADPKCRPKIQILLQNRDKHNQSPTPASPFSNTNKPGSHRSSISDTNMHRPHSHQPRSQEPREAKLAS
jgi:hypothetical protein